MEAWLYSGLNVVRKCGQFYGSLSYSIFCGRNKDKSKVMLNSKEPAVTHVGWEGWGLCFCDLCSDFFSCLDKIME